MISTRRRIESATGYLALGMLTEASDELEAIEGEDRLLPEVMSMRTDFYIEAKQWDLLLAVSRELTRQRPNHVKGWIGWAYALRELNRLAEAKAVLLEAEPIHGEKCALLRYNLACYCCLWGDLAAAKEWLSQACKMDDHWKKAALEDEDLKAMWDDIAAMK
jgi:tetratricopeptide (TPR) repeat protein